MLAGACEAPPEADEQPAPVTTSTSWITLGSWSGRGDRQTESFDITTGSLRVTWESAGRFALSLHSAISGRPLELIADSEHGGLGTVRVAAEPRVAYLLIEADEEEWHITLEEGALATPQ